MINVQTFILQTTNFYISFYSLLTIIIALVGYVFYLSSRLSKKKLLIDSITTKIQKIDKKIEKEDILKFLNKLENTSISSLISKDHIFNDDIMKYIYESEIENKIFTHYTKEKLIADTIIKEGFKFVDSFHKTAEGLYKDKITFVYKHNLRKQYGNYIVIIAISNDLYDYYSNELKKTSKPNLYVEHVLSEYITNSNEDLEIGYLLPSQFVKGYINNETGEIINNPNFNPAYKSEKFDKNLKRI